MYARTKAIIASFGLINEDVNATPFIKSMFARASARNPEFNEIEKINQVKIEAFVLSEKFNRGKIGSQEFKAELLALLGNIEISNEEFWREWNAMINPGNILKTVKDINFALGNSNTLRLYSDTNPAHMESLRSALMKQYLHLDLDCTPAKLEGLNLYLSYREQTNRLGLIENVYTKLQQQVFKPSEIILIVGNPANIEDEMQKSLAEAELKKIQDWCKVRMVQVVLHDKTNKLQDTIKNIISPENRLNTESNQTYSPTVRI